MKKKLKKFTFFEKVLLTITMIVILSSPVMMIFAKSSLSKTNYEVEEIKDKVENQEKTNNDIQMTINRLASLENMENIAKQAGLSYTSKSIKMVE